MDDPTLPKPWYASKTVYLGLAMSSLGIAQYFAIPEHTPVLTVASISAAGVGVLTVIVRVWFTSAPVAGTARAAKAARARAEAVTQGVAIQLRARGVA